MIKEGSRIVLRTVNAIYSTCQVTAISNKSVTITYCAGMKRDRETGEYHMVSPVETIPAKEIVCMSERV